MCFENLAFILEIMQFKNELLKNETNYVTKDNIGIYFDLENNSTKKEQQELNNNNNNSNNNTQFQYNDKHDAISCNNDCTYHILPKSEIIYANLENPFKQAYLLFNKYIRQNEAPMELNLAFDTRNRIQLFFDKKNIYSLAFGSKNTGTKIKLKSTNHDHDKLNPEQRQRVVSCESSTVPNSIDTRTYVIAQKSTSVGNDKPDIVDIDIAIDVSTTGDGSEENLIKLAKIFDGTIRELSHMLDGCFNRFMKCGSGY